MATRETIRTIEALRRLHGPGIPDYPGSPHDGEPIDDAELILHELGHLIQNPRRFPLIPGDVDADGTRLGDYLEKRPTWWADLHEMRAIAIELVAARKLGIRLVGYRVIENSIHNTKLFHNFTGSTFMLSQYGRYIARIKKLRSTQIYANAIVTLVKRERKKSL